MESIWRTLAVLEFDPQGTEKRRELLPDMTSEMRLLFDGANSDLIVPQRTASVSPLQALFLMNSEYVRSTTERFAARLYRLPDDPRRIREAYVLLFSREPTAEELATGKDFLASWEVLPTDKKPGNQKSPDVPPIELAKWQAYLQALLLTNEFMFVD